MRYSLDLALVRTEDPQNGCLESPMSNVAHQTKEDPLTGTHLIVGGLATLGVCLLAYLAFDDITTDNATAFRLEYTCLVFCAAWCLFVSLRLIAGGNRLLGIVSLVALIGAIWGRRKIGPATIPSLKPEYISTVTGLVWFLTLSVILVVIGFRHLPKVGEQPRGEPPAQVGS